MNMYLKRIVFLLSVLLSYACSADILDDSLRIAISSDPRNDGIVIDVDDTLGTKIVFDIEEVQGDKSAKDVFRLFLQFSSELYKVGWVPKDVILSSFGNAKFILPAEDMGVIGKEYGTQNPMYTIRTFPEKLLLEDESSAYQKHQGGVFYLMQVQMKDFNDFLGKWFIEDLIAVRKKQQGFVEPEKFDDDEAF